MTKKEIAKKMVEMKDSLVELRKLIMTQVGKKAIQNKMIGYLDTHINDMQTIMDKMPQGADEDYNEDYKQMSESEKYEMRMKRLKDKNKEYEKMYNRGK